MLKKYMSNPSHVLQDQPLGVQENLTYEEGPLRIQDRKEQVLRMKVIPMVEILLNNHGIEEAT